MVFLDADRPMIGVTTASESERADTLGLRGDVTVWTVDAVDDPARLELARLPGVRQVESTRFVPVTLVHGHRRERGLIAELRRVLTEHAA